MPDSSVIKHAFDAARAEVYDQQFEPVRGIKDLLHLIIQVQLSHLPRDARILIVGAGTGAEARFLAPIFPEWRFTLVDPAEAMLGVAKRHAQAEGFADRCVFHVGFVSSLSDQTHDAATSVLASHFLTDANDRQSYFEDIAARVKPGGILFNADLCADRDSSSFDVAMDLWLRVLNHASPLDEDGRAKYRAMFGKDVAVHGSAEVEAIMARAGFTDIAACYQAVLIRGWVATRR